MAAQFEQASLYYRTTCSHPLMSGMQLAQAIATQEWRDFLLHAFECIG